MAPEQVKTQVLILHSDQGALDTLSACIEDRFTVHCAKTGTEALHALGDTPIHVIISAQNLPGMSGLDALREAKKRSPGTMGILLAGRNDSSVEALVGQKEIFQIVRGGITSSDLNRLIDDATQQMRLLALAESANDTAANPDEPVAEHIVMETAENGSTIISDGTGTWSALSPEKASAGQSAEPDVVDILVITKDQEFFATVQESSRGVHNIRYANTPAQADDAFAKYAIAVAVVDAAMFGPNVEDLTQQLRMRTERLVCIVAGRRDDGEMLMDLINRGKVYRFLLKPVSPGRARLAIEASVKHHLEAPDTAFELSGAAAVAEQEESPPAKGILESKPAQQVVANSSTAVKPQPESTALKIEEVPATPGTSDQPFVIEASGDADANDSRTGIHERVSADIKPAMSRDDTGRGRAAGKSKLFAFGIVAAVIAGGAYYFTAAIETAPTPTPVESRPLPRNDEAVGEARPVPEPEPAAVALVDELLTAAETAVLERRAIEAIAALEQVRLADPGNARLPFLTAQVTRMRLRTLIDDARAAIREARFADAASALRAANTLGVADTSEIEAVTLELSTAQSAERTDELLDRAAASIDADKLLAPANDNAVHYYRLIVTNDPDNVAAQQGLKAVAGKLVLKARDHLDQAQFDQADDLLVAAKDLDPASSEIAASMAAVADARQQIVNDQLREEQARRKATLAEAERLAASGNAGADPETAVVAATAARAENIVVVEPPVEMPASAPLGAEIAAENDLSAPNLAEPSRLVTEPTVSITSLKRIKYVAPKYPRSASRRNQSGWVDLIFTVGVDGMIKDIEIEDANPGDLFVNAATRAVEKWEFEPVFANGEPVEKRARIRMMFALE